ncbi:MAG: hypothetical protein M3220_22370 [Chloroflexota bacterium]|nr:hypothetical protein [Chloroflexota bacterium]
MREIEEHDYSQEMEAQMEHLDEQKPTQDVDLRDEAVERKAGRKATRTEPSPLREPLVEQDYSEEMDEQMDDVLEDEV